MFSAVADRYSVVLVPASSAMDLGSKGLVESRRREGWEFVSTTDRHGDELLLFRQSD
jgi:hypothetical protein